MLSRAASFCFWVRYVTVLGDWAVEDDYAERWNRPVVGDWWGVGGIDRQEGIAVLGAAYDHSRASWHR